MKNLRPSFLYGAAVLGLTVLLLPACDGPRPLVPGASRPGALPSDCTGVLGNNTVGNLYTTANDLFFYPVVPASTTTLVKLSLYISSATPVTFEMGVYADNGSGTAPTTLLSETGSESISPSFTGWMDLDLKKNVAMSAGTTFWLAYQASPATSVPDHTAAGAYCYQAAGPFGSLASSFTGTVDSGYTFSLYGTSCP